LKAGDLSATVSVLPKATDESRHDEAGVIDLLAETDEVPMSRDLLDPALQTKERLLLLLGEDRTRSEAAHKELKGRVL
jgi:hypothetical protein